jgi:predicted nucleic acid-binding protein
MALYLLDTNILSYLLDTRAPSHRQVRAALERLGPDDEALVSVLSLYELHHWLAFDSAPRELADEVVRAFDILPLPQDGTRHFGALMRDLRPRLPRADLRRHKVDCMIAVTAREHGAALVSNDGLFRQLALALPGLALVDWTA